MLPIRKTCDCLATAALLAAALAPAPRAVAEQAASAVSNDGAHLSIELNALVTAPDENACQISFMIQNGHGADIAQAVFEAVLFDGNGQVERLTLFDFGALPAGRPRVRQFIVPGVSCAGLGRVLINGAKTCTGQGLPEDACTEGLELRSRAGVEVLG